MLLGRPKVVGVSRSKAEDDLARMLVIRTSLEAEMGASRASERQGRLIDHDGAASMEAKKQEGYF